MTNEEILALLRYQRTRFPADGEALDRIEALLGSGSPKESAPAPSLSFPLRVQPAKACSLGWSPELFALTVLISNVALRQEDGALVQRGRGPIVAVCAEYDRALTSLEPPVVARHALSNARSEGVPTLRLPGGLLRAPLRLEPTSRIARAPADREGALGRAEKFFDQLDEAWQRRIGSVLEVAWPVYRPERSGPLLDAVAGAPLPDLALG